MLTPGVACTADTSLQRPLTPPSPSHVCSHPLSNSLLNSHSGHCGAPGEQLGQTYRSGMRSLDSAANAPLCCLFLLPLLLFLYLPLPCRCLLCLLALPVTKQQTQNPLLQKKELKEGLPYAQATTDQIVVALTARSYRYHSNCLRLPSQWPQQACLWPERQQILSAYLSAACSSLRAATRGSSLYAASTNSRSRLPSSFLPFSRSLEFILQHAKHHSFNATVIHLAHGMPSPPIP